jgi:NADPH:quinone reductase-like Zn-dependent oxidoreductase
MSLAVQFSEYGSLDGLRLVDLPPLTAGPGQLRLAVRTAGVNPADWKIFQGQLRGPVPLDFPAGLGSDVAGVVDQVGEGVTEFAVGDDVLGSSLTPSYAQSALADPAALIAKPPGLPWEVAGTLAAAGGTAWTVLNMLGVKEGETLLIHAVAGGVGTLTAQLAVARGLRVIGTASENHHADVRALGAIPVTYGDGLADRVWAIAPNGVDAVLDASGRGEIPVSIELAGGPERVLTLVAFDQGDTGIQIQTGGAGKNLPHALHDIAELIEAGRLRIPIWGSYPLTEAMAALEAIHSGHVSGKIIITP